MTDVHIGGHDSGNVVWKGGITTIPLRRRDGALLQTTPVDGDRIAEPITWPLRR